VAESGDVRTPVPLQGLLGEVTPHVAWSPGSPPSLEVVLGDSSIPLFDFSEEFSLLGEG
jgi:hypothetical protein